MTKSVKASAVSKKTKNIRNSIDCTKCVEDSFMKAEDLCDFLASRFKVKGKIENLGSDVQIFTSQSKVVVSSSIPYSKRYLKYLTKKWLKKLMLRDWIRVVSSSKNTYELRYYNIPSDGEEEE